MERLKGLVVIVSCCACWLDAHFHVGPHCYVLGIVLQMPVHKLLVSWSHGNCQKDGGTEEEEHGCAFSRRDTADWHKQQVVTFGSMTSSDLGLSDICGTTLSPCWIRERW